MVTFGVFCIRVLEVMFFTGLAGCTVVVLFSWISILKSGFSDKDDVKTVEIPVRTHQPTAYRFAQPDLGTSRAFSNSIESSKGQSSSR